MSETTDTPETELLQVKGDILPESDDKKAVVIDNGLIQKVNQKRKALYPTELKGIVDV